MAKPDFSLVWAENSPLSPYTFSDANYLTGWNFIGSVPPDRRMFDAWFKRTDLKMQWLDENSFYLLRENSTVYHVNDIAFSQNLPSYLYLKCIAAGTTSSTEPSFSGATEGGTVTDGTVTWEYTNIAATSGGGYNTRDVVTTSGTYTAPVDGWYQITVKGGGSGGNAGYYTSTDAKGGAGGGEGGITIAFEYMSAGDTATVVVGGGGNGGTTNGALGANGGNSSVTVNGNTYSGGGATHGNNTVSPGSGGSGTIPGAVGTSSGGSAASASNSAAHAGSGGGNGGGAPSAGSAGGNAVANSGAGGAGGAATVNSLFRAGGKGADGFVWFEYFAE